MRIYTKTGDQGETGLFGGPRVPKSHPRVEAYGTVDELNSVLGMAITRIPDQETGLVQELNQIQRELFDVGAMLATPAGRVVRWQLEESAIERLESAIDRMEADLPPLKTFVLPSGSEAGAGLHLARTVARRAERRVVGVLEETDPRVVRYLNRLSDYLFVAARWINHRLGQVETAVV